MKKTLSLLLVAMMTMMASSVKSQSFFEDFNNDTLNGALPAGWTVYGDTLTNHPAYAQYNQSWQVWYPGGSARTGEAMSVTFTVDTWEPCDRWLITPHIALPADSEMTLLFWQYGMGLGQPSVKVSTTGTDPADFTTLLGHITTQSYKQQECFSLAAFAGDSIYIAFVNDVVHTNGHCSQFVALDDIEVKYLPQNSIALVDVVLPEQATVNQPVTATLKVTNYGGNHVGSLTYSCQVGDNAPNEHTATVNIWPYRTANINVTFVPTSFGEETIEFRVGMPNGTDDYDTSDNRIVRTLTVMEEPPVNIHAVEEYNQVMVYPNPTHGKVTIVGANDYSPEVEAAWLTDPTGRREEVSLTCDGHGQYTLDLTARPQAPYLLTITTADGRQHTVRLLKQSD